MGNADVCRGEGSFSYRVAMYGHKSIPSREGGIEVVVQELAVRLVLKGCDVTCINRGGDHAFFEPDNNEIVSGYFRGVKIETVPTIDKGGLGVISSLAIIFVHHVLYSSKIKPEDIKEI